MGIKPPSHERRWLRAHLGQRVRIRPAERPESTSVERASLGDRAIRWSRTRPRVFDAIILFLLTLTIYLWSNRGLAQPFNQNVLLADAFLHGHLDLIRPASWLELASWHGHSYVLDPPLPAVLLMPFVALFGTTLPEAAISILAGAIDAGLCYLVTFKLVHHRATAIWVSILYAFGTIQWYHAENGASWYVHSSIASLFIWLALLELVTKRRLLLVGLSIGCAYLTRSTAILAAVFVLVYCWDQFIPRRDSRGAWNLEQVLDSCASLGSGLLPALLLSGLYNYARFGDALTDPHAIELASSNQTTAWTQYGLMSVRYVPIHLQEMFTALPAFRSTWPYLVPSIWVMAIWFTTPAFVLALFAPLRSRLTVACWAAIVAISIPILAFGANGFTQFGYRYTLDFTPFLLILVATAIGSRINWAEKTLITLSVAVNLWGVLMLTFFNICNFGCRN